MNRWQESMEKGVAWLYRAPRGGESEGLPALESRERGESADPPAPPAEPVGTEGVRDASAGAGHRPGGLGFPPVPTHVRT